MTKGPPPPPHPPPPQPPPPPPHLPHHRLSHQIPLRRSLHRSRPQHHNARSGADNAFWSGESSEPEPELELDGGSNTPRQPRRPPAAAAARQFHPLRRAPPPVAAVAAPLARRSAWPAESMCIISPGSGHIKSGPRASARRREREPGAAGLARLLPRLLPRSHTPTRLTAGALSAATWSSGSGRRIS